jgi:hypothetical protein
VTPASGRSLAKIQAIVEAAERNPRRFGPLVVEMDRNGRIDAMYRKLRQMQDEEKRLAVKTTERQIFNDFD